MNELAQQPAAVATGWSSYGSVEKDLELTEADFARVRELIHKRAGIVLAEHKREMVYSRLAKRLRHYSLTRFSDYLARLERRPDSQEWEAFTNALTTNLTAFFREAHHFPQLVTHIRDRTGSVRIWCAAASTGEEPYSIAITLAETFSNRTVDAKVVATDIDTEALAKARAGIYPLEQVHKLDEARIKRFFQRGTGGQAGLARVRPEIRAMVEFQQMNLMAPQWPVKGPFDAIFCRNTMIYFDKKTQAQILGRFAPLLKPDGLLFAGHSENFSHISDAFRLRGQTIYTVAR